MFWTLLYKNKTSLVVNQFFQLQKLTNIDKSGFLQINFTYNQLTKQITDKLLLITKTM